MKNAVLGQLADGDEKLNGQGLSVGVVQSRFNFDITNALSRNCIEELKRLGVDGSAIELVTVPGALEIPIALQTLAQSDAFDVLIAVGCVIRGETYHFEIVANESARCISDVALTLDIPIVNMVLTTENHMQAVERIDVKGVEAAQCAVEMANLVNQQWVTNDE